MSSQTKNTKSPNNNERDRETNDSIALTKPKRIRKKVEKLKQDNNKRPSNTASHNRSLKQEASHCFYCEKEISINECQCDHYYPVNMTDFIYDQWGPNIDPPVDKERMNWVKVICTECHRLKTKDYDKLIRDDIKEIIKYADSKYPNIINILKEYNDEEDFKKNLSLSSQEKEDIICKKNERKKFITNRLLKEMHSRINFKDNKSREV